MPNILAKIGVYGDPHLSSKNYGAHRNYPKESLHYFSLISKAAVEEGWTHIIGAGDLTYGRFLHLEYRELVEQELEKQYKAVYGNAYSLKGNHDSATYGMTEYEYYVKKGLLKPSCNFSVGAVNISMVDSKAYGTTDVNIVPGGINVVIHHDFFKFTDTNMADYGASIELDHFEKWYGADYIIGGHIHNFHTFDGTIINSDGTGHRALCVYPGCPARPNYREGSIDEIGHYIVLTVFDDDTMQFDLRDIELWDIAESFNLEIKKAEKQLKEEKEARVDISDVVSNLAMHERNIGNPEDIIESLAGVDAKYKTKAVALLKSALA